MTNCKSCSAVLAGNFCSNCGQPAKTKRIDGHYIKALIAYILGMMTFALIVVLNGFLIDLKKDRISYI